jgi:hypothetical protein
MKGIISKTPVTIADRKGTRQANVFITIAEDRRSSLGQFREFTMHDFEVIPKANPQPGEPINDYLLIEENKKREFFSEVDQTWTSLNKDIVNGQSFESQIDQLYIDFLMKEAQEEPLRDSTSDNWEVHDTETAIQP